MHASLIKQSVSQSTHSHAHKAHFNRFRRTSISAEWIPAYCANVVMLKLSGQFLSNIGVSFKAKSLIMAVQGKHIYERHRNDSKTIISYLPSALSNIKYIGKELKKDKYKIIGMLPNKRYLFTAIKFVQASNASSNQDEAWISTSYIISEKNIMKKLKAKEIRPLLTHRISLNYNNL